MHAPGQSRWFEAPLFPELLAALSGELDEASRMDPLGSILLVTPIPELGVHALSRALRPAAPPVRIESLTLVELATRLSAPQRWRAGQRILPEAGDTVLARRALARDRRPPGFFSGALELRGFRGAMASAFEELAAAGLGAPQEIERFIVRHGETLDRRTRHALELFLGYRRVLEATHQDRWTVLRRVGEMDPQDVAAILQSHRLWFYGFDQLERIERRLVENLSRAMELTFFCLPGSAARPGLSVWLQSLGLTRMSPNIPPSPPPAASLLSSPGEEAEAQEIARRVLQAAAEGTPFHDMAVVTRTAAGLPLIEETLTGLGVPCHAPTLYPLATRRVGRALLQWLELADEEWSPRSVLEFLLLVPARWSEWCEISEDPVTSSWERVARESHLGSGLDDWRLKLGREHAAWNRGRHEPGERRSRAATAAALARTELLRVAEVLGRELGTVPGRARWSDFVDLAADFVSRAMHRDAESRLLLQALGAMRNMDSLAGPRPSRADFREALRQQLGRVRVPSRDSTEAGVVLGCADELYGRDFEWIALAGLQEGEWPGPVSEDPILPDRVRHQLNHLLGDPQALPLRVQQVERQRALFRTLVSAARHRIVLSFARLDPTTAATRLPSSLLVEFAEQRHGGPLDYEELASLHWFERVPLRRRELPATGPILSEEEFDALTVAQFPPAAARRYVRKLGVAAARGLALETLRNGRPRFTVFDGLLSGRDARETLSRTLETWVFSASQLTSYATCPFRYFMRHLLRVEPLDRAERREPSVLEVGLLVHGILERFYGTLTAEGFHVADLDFEVSRNRLLQAAETEFAALEARGQQGARLLWEIRKQSLREDLGRFLRKEVQRFRAGEAWVPAQFEARFGGEHGGSPAVPYGDRTIRFRGVMDRVDHHRQHDGVCVVDYKSGRTAPSRRNPQALQLVLYLMAACRSDSSRIRRSEARFLYVTRRGGFMMQRLAGARLDVRREDFATLVRQIYAGIAAGELFPQPGPHASHCTVCDYRNLCDARIARQVQRKGGGDQDSRWRELPDFGHDLEPVDGSTEGTDHA